MPYDTTRRNKPSESDILATVSTRLKASKDVVIDVETSGLDWRKCFSCGYVLNFSADPRDGFYLPIRHEGGGNLNPEKTLRMLREGINGREDLRTIYYHGAFDLKFMHVDGIHPAGWIEDGMINAVLIDERQPGFSLEKSCEFAGVTPKLGEALYAHLAEKFGGAATRRTQMGNYWRLAGDDPYAVEYALGDGVSTWELVEIQQGPLDTQDLRRVWEVECRLIPILHKMMMRGIKIDQERLAQVRRLIAAKYQAAMRKLPEGFNTNASTELAKLFTDRGIEFPHTARGNPSFTESWLETIELGQQILAARRLRHLEESFLGPLANEHLWNGRVHCNYNQTLTADDFGVISGRLSCNEPNLQQVHKRNKLLGSLFRSIFIPDSGLEWISADYKQIEPKLAAHYAQIKSWIAGYLADPPINAHSVVGEMAKVEYDLAKRLNQAMMLGAGRLKISLMMGGSLDQAVDVMRRYWHAVPELKRFREECGLVWKTRGYIRSLLGRRARIATERDDYKGVSRLLQMSNADILKRSMVLIDDYLEDNPSATAMINNIHDDIAFQTEATLDKNILKGCFEIMRDYGPGRSIDITLPMDVDIGRGRNWAEATYGVETVKKSFEEMGGRYA